MSQNDRQNSDKTPVFVIMAGGFGTRFWPLSTKENPKQFLDLFGHRSLLQQCFDRISGLTSPDRVLVLTNQSLTPLVRKHLPELPEDNIIGEPARRDTAAAVALAAFICRERYGQVTMAVLAADHLIEPRGIFTKTLLSAVRAADAGKKLYTFGISPTYPATGYGYLELGECLDDDNGIKHFKLISFKEKPDFDTARNYLESGRYRWNSGMFVWRTDTIINEIKQHLPQHYDAFTELIPSYRTPAWEKRLQATFEALKPISIDFGVMEKARHVSCVSCSFNWSDVGGWPALDGLLDQCGKGNSARGQLVTHQAGGNLVYALDESEQVALVGVSNLIVVRAGKQTLIVPKDRAEEIKHLVAKLQDAN
ncbi:MAG: mannose-1-phosphate guanylyltransferase [Deltaproteobacteria bacterium]|nr:mannose-1-phosphate guanylyltransferase [Deltaproteobacteria bacterium]